MVSVFSASNKQFANTHELRNHDICILLFKKGMIGKNSEKHLQKKKKKDFYSKLKIKYITGGEQR